MIVLVDIDDCLNNLCDVSVQIAKEYWNAEPDLTKGDGYSFKHIFNKTDKEVTQFFADEYKALFVETPVKEGAARVLQWLKSKGLEIHICTARKAEWKCGLKDLVVVTEEWLKEHSIPYDALVFTRDKAAYAKDVNAMIAIDDFYRNAEEYAEVGCPVIKFNHEYTKPITHPICTNVETWDEVEGIFKMLLGE